MRIFFVFIFLAMFISSLSAQCFNTKIENIFNYQCTPGNPIGARIGLDIVEHTATDWGNISISNGSFIVFKNNINVGSSTSYNSGDVIRIEPFATGVSNIGILTDESGCPPDWGSDRNVCLTTPMPITYQNQPTAKLQNNQTQITWSVATQINNEKYIIEHSNDGRNFSPIGEIAGDGTSNITKHYEYIHTSPSIGINYYRIKQVDYDGKYSYSDITSVRYDGNRETSIYPNPATSDVTITTTSSTSLQIIDVYGRLLLNRDIPDGQNTINISGLPSGILIFVVGDQRYKVLKE